MTVVDNRKYHFIKWLWKCVNVPLFCDNFECATYKSIVFMNKITKINQSKYQTSFIPQRDNKTSNDIKWIKISKVNHNNNNNHKTQQCVMYTNLILGSKVHSDAWWDSSSSSGGGWWLVVVVEVVAWLPTIVAEFNRDNATRVWIYK